MKKRGKKTYSVESMSVNLWLDVHPSHPFISPPLPPHAHIQAVEPFEVDLSSVVMMIDRRRESDGNHRGKDEREVTEKKKRSPVINQPVISRLQISVLIRSVSHEEL